jgi:hypothetical protein
MSAKSRRRYVDIGDDEFGPDRVLLVMWGKVAGYIARWTQPCSGCTPGYEEVGTYPLEGNGCHECGYTGKRRQRMWFPMPKRVQRSLMKPRPRSTHV